MAVTTSQVAEIYTATFNRAPDAAGLAYWVNDSFGGNATIEQIASSFFDSAEAQAIYTSTMTTTEKVTEAYQNLFNRAPDADGLAYWVGQLDTGAISQSNMLIALVNGALAADATIMDNKTTVGLAFADAGLNDVTDATSVMSGVTADTATVTAAQTSINNLAHPAVALTTATTDNLTGTAGADTFTAVNSSGISEGTLQGSDKIDGGEGADKLSVTMKQSFAGFTTGSMANVETVELTNGSTAALSFTATGVTGVTKYVVTNGDSQNTTLADLGSLADIEVSGETGTTTLSATYRATSTVATGTQTDVQNLKVTNAGTIDTSTTGTSNAKYMTVDIDKVETLAITTAGTANSLDLSGSANTTSITIAGEGQTEINAIDDSVTSFDASSSNGKVIANLTAATTNTVTTVKSGAGDDMVTVSLDDLTSSATVNGGAGADTLVVSAATTTKQLNMSGFETLKLSTPASVNGMIFSGTNVTGLNTVTVAAGAMAGNASFVNMGANALTLNTVGAVTGNTISADNSAAVTVNLTKTATAAATETTTSNLTFNNASALTVNVGEYQKYGTGTITTGATGAVTLNVASKVVNSSETTSFDSILTANSASSITVAASGDLGANTVINAGEATTGTITAGSSTNAAEIKTLAAAKMTSLTITANGSLDMEAAGATVLTKLQTLNATTAGTLDFTGVDLVDAANVTVGGTATTAAATFDMLGATTLTHDVNVTATGLKAGLTVNGNTGAGIDAGTAKVTLDVSGVTGNVAMGTNTILGNAGATINAKNLAGTFNVGNIGNASTVGAVSIDATNIGGALSVGTVTTTGDVTVTATNAVSTVATGAIIGNNVTINAQNALGAMTIGNGTTGGTDVTAKTSVTYTGTNLNNNGIDILAGTNSTALAATLNGGAANEVFTIAGTTTQTGITVSGNLGAGTNSVTTTLADSTANAQAVTLSGLTSSATAGDATFETTTNIAAALVTTTDDALTFTGSVKDDKIVVDSTVAAVVSTKAVSISDTTTTDADAISFVGVGVNAISFTQLSLSGIEKLIVDDTAAVTINASAISDKVIAVNGAAANDILGLTGTAGADVIDLSKVTDGGNDAAFTITAGAGNDTMVGSVFADKFVFEATASANGVDTITSFTKTNDTIDVKAFESAGAEVTIATGAMTTTAGTVYELGGLAAGSADSLTAAAAAITAGATWTAAAATAWVILSDDNSTSIYEWTEATGAGATAAELTLVGTIATAMSTAEIATATLIA